MNLVFKETDIFTKLITQLLSDDEYKELQEHLIERPDAGVVIEGTAGLRKVRWAAKGGGKSGGVRIIYYWITEDCQIYMLLAYPKSKQDNLTATQKKVLKALVLARILHTATHELAYFLILQTFLSQSAGHTSTALNLKKAFKNN